MAQFSATAVPPGSPPTRMPEAADAPPADLLDGASLFLDFDGTLVDIVERPDAVAVDAPLAMLMEELAERLQGRLAIISGRPRAEIDALFGHCAFAVGGSHGLELRWPDGRATSPEPPSNLPRLTGRLREAASRYPGTLVEDKPFGVALHYRGAPQHEGACRHLAQALAEESGLALQPGKMVFELRMRGADKGAALAALLDAPPMRGTRPIFMGDDLTDEPAFRAAAERGGAGILVGEARPSAARYRLANVAAVRSWLEAAVAPR